MTILKRRYLRRIAHEAVEHPRTTLAVLGILGSAAAATLRMIRRVDRTKEKVAHATAESPTEGVSEALREEQESD